MDAWEKRISVACDIIKWHKVQHCNAKIDDWTHWTQIIFQSCKYTQSLNFLKYMYSKFHNNMYESFSSFEDNCKT